MRALSALWLLSCSPLSNHTPDPSSVPDNELGGLDPVVVGDCALLGWWPMDDGEGDTVADLSGNGRDLTLGKAGDAPSGPAWADGHDGSGGLEFSIVSYARSGSGGQLARSDDPAFHGLGAVTLSVWVLAGVDTLHGQVVVGAGGSTSWFNPYALFLANGDWEQRLLLSDGASSLSYAAPPLALERWVHLAATADGATGTWALYQDGVQVDGGLHAYQHFADLGGPFVVGMDFNESGCPEDDGQWCFPFAGELDELKVLDCALSADEIAREHETGWPWDG